MSNLEKLRKCDEHLSIAVAYLNTGSYVGSLGDFKKLVRIKLKLETVLRRVQAGREWETRRKLK